MRKAFLEFDLAGAERSKYPRHLCALCRVMQHNKDRLRKKERAHAESFC